MGLFNAGRALSIALKETRHILRDPFTIGMAIGMPLVYVIFFGSVIDFNYRNVSITVEDRDKTRVSRELVETFTSSGYFRMEPLRAGESSFKPLQTERSSGVLIIEPGFGRKTLSGQQGGAQLLIDGADNSKAGALQSYLSGVSAAAGKRFAGERTDFLRLKTRFLFNPELNSKYLTIPGLAVVLTGLISVLLTALTVAREWETGSMELLLSTPVRPMEIVVGKLLPYCALSFATVFLVYLAARLMFGVPFTGSHLLYTAGYLLFTVAALAQGLVISVITRQQQIAMQIAMISGLLPSLLLSGFLFAIESMPAFFQALVNVLPPRWFMVISRGIFLKGSGFADLIVPFAALLLLDALLVGLAVKKFKTDLEP